MRSIVCILVVVMLIACKDNTVTAPVVQEEEKPELTKAQKLEIMYGVQLSKTGDTLLPFIPQDSVVSFFKQYGALHPENKVRIKTKYGNIDVRLFDDQPLYRASFIFLVKNRYFDETEFYRVVPDFIVQAGNSDSPLSALKRSSSGNYKLPPRYDPERKHKRGSLSMAKQWENNPEDWHKPFDFFITLSSASHLDGAHTIVGEVTSGMAVADKIAAQERDASDWPKEEVYLTVEVLDKE